MCLAPLKRVGVQGANRQASAEKKKNMLAGLLPFDFPSAPVVLTEDSWRDLSLV